jgi:hypothetical protein
MATKAVKHPEGCKNFTIRYQWIAEMCGYRRTEADIVGVLIGYTETAFSTSGRGTKEGWDTIEMSVSLLSRMACASVRSTQEALRWLESHGIVHVTERAGKGGLNLRRGYRLDLDLLDEVAVARDRSGVPMQVVRREKGHPAIVEIPGFGRQAATGVRKRRGTTMVQKSHGDGAEIAPEGAETASLEVQKLHGTSVQKSHPCYHGEVSIKDPGELSPTPAKSGGVSEENENEHDPEEEYEDDFPKSSLPVYLNRGYRPDRKISDLPPLRNSPNQISGKKEAA